jgi:hypothetical protein
MKIAEIKARDKLREEGGWVRGGFSDLPGIALKVRGYGCSAHIRRNQELVDAASADERKDPKFGENIAKRVLKEVILLGWDLDGDEFTPENVTEMLDLKTFRDEVEFASRVVGARGTATLEDDAKN